MEAPIENPPSSKKKASGPQQKRGEESSFASSASSSQASSPTEKPSERELTKASPAPRPPLRAPRPPQPIEPSPDEIRAHPDANLTREELLILYHKLIEERKRVLSNFERHVGDALADEGVLVDEIDIAQRSSDQAWLIRMADKDRKLLLEIDAALEKMRTGEYGICEGTEEPIGFKRLEIRPWTRYSVAYKELLEREKSQQAR
ncbi:MAG: TraR/DksA family transcriptional regulator [Sandaracinaceae bacterium]|nr:TraR/DksA family transcriptional regulator [Sandaracinaceae bacterium]MDW8244975.1 TraR/DksA family transcriptional regulator [Sandaracinaceae bacterium]